ncbi:MAG: NAD kinase [Flavobacteriales bacterium]|nr:NAD kinase [Flavobacteriales bacterium]
MIFLLHGKKFSKEVGEEIIKFINAATAENIDVIYTDMFYKLLKKSLIKDNNKSVKTISSLGKLRQKIDYLVCFGGDGTILNATTIVKKTNIPIVGINTGRLGFLATISKYELSSLIKKLKKKEYTVSARALLEMKVDNTKIKFPFALNEISVSSKENTSMIKIKVLLNNEYLNTYWADGLIISTPTGSTGYSLSCGGPIVMPKSKNFIITPIAPHNLNVRPLIVSDEHIIKIEIINNTENKFLLSMDSRNQYVNKNQSITIKKAKFSINLLELKSTSYSKTLREKLLWGLDTRNYEN